MPTEEEILSFSKKIEEFAKGARIGIMDSIVEYCNKNELEIETVSSLISQKLKQKIRQEAEDLNLIAKANTLPL